MHRPTESHILASIIVEAQLIVFIHNGGKIARRRSRK